MGRTVPSYRIATEIERNKWKIFKQQLNKKDKKLFDQMFDYSRQYNSAGSNVTRSQLIHPILMSILLEHYRQLDSIQKQLKIES